MNCKLITITALQLVFALVCLNGCSWQDGLDVADPVISEVKTPQNPSRSLGPLANAYDREPDAGLTPSQTYDLFHTEVIARRTEGAYVYLSQRSRDRLSEVALAMSVTDAQTLIDGLLKDPSFAAFAPEESVAKEAIEGDKAVVTTRSGLPVNMVREKGTWRIDF